MRREKLRVQVSSTAGKGEYSIVFSPNSGEKQELSIPLFLGNDNGQGITIDDAEQKIII